MLFLLDQHAPVTYGRALQNLHCDQMGLVLPSQECECTACGGTGCLHSEKNTTIRKGSQVKSKVDFRACKLVIVVMLAKVGADKLYMA